MYASQWVGSVIFAGFKQNFTFQVKPRFALFEVSGVIKAKNFGIWSIFGHFRELRKPKFSLPEFLVVFRQEILQFFFRQFLSHLSLKLVNLHVIMKYYTC